MYTYEPHVTIPIGWPQFVGHAWRTGNDIRKSKEQLQALIAQGPSYTALLGELANVNAWAGATGPGAFGDADM